MDRSSLPLRVNPDYEAVLFGGPSSAQVNESLEFLAWFLEDAPLYTQKKYSSDYLAHVESVSSQTPEIAPSGSYHNWWGSLEDEATERVLNSKLTSTKLLLARDTHFQARIISHPHELEKVPFSFPWLIKNPHSMAGRGFQRVNSLNEVRLPKKMEQLIVEPLRNRTHDFSHFIFSNGEEICYQNMVDEKFQYRGTVFGNWREATLGNLSFYQEVSPQEWGHFQGMKSYLISAYQELSKDLKQQIGFSLDSFVYQEKEGLKIHAASEINYRRTMGSVAWSLAKKYAGENSWVSLRLEKPQNGFLKLQRKIQSESLDKNIILLSPGDTRFDLYLLMAENAGEGERLTQQLSQLLTNT